MRPHEIIQPRIITELLRLARLDRQWLFWHYVDNQGTTFNPAGGDRYDHCRRYAAHPKFETWIWNALNRGDPELSTGADWFGMYADSIWLLDGPKTFRPTPDQCRGLEQVEVNLSMNDYRQPFPAIMVELPAEYAPFVGCIVCNENGMLNCVMHTADNEGEIVTTIAPVADVPIELSLTRFDPDCVIDGQICSRALRVAVNSCLALGNWPHSLAPLYPKELESDRHFARHAKNEDSRQRASQRVSLAVQSLTFDQDISFHHVEGGTRYDGEPTGRHVTTHWRRGHWAKQVCGVGRSERRLIFRKAVMVRADLFAGDTANTAATYKG